MPDSNDAALHADYTRLVPIICTALRLLGVYITIVGTSLVVEDLATMASALGVESASTNFFLERTRPRFFGNAVYLASGLYLIFGGRWLIENVFLPTSAVTDDTNSDEGTAS